MRCSARTVVAATVLIALAAWPRASAFAQSLAAAPKQDESTTALRASVRVEAGATQRLITVPATQGKLSFTSNPVPALALQLTAAVMGTDLFGAVHLGYQTSVGLVAHESLTLDPSASSVATRSHRFEAGVTPGLLLGSRASPAQLGISLNYVLRAFASVSPLAIPAYTLHGPAVRLELELPLFGLLSIRLAPEVALILGVTPALRRAAILTGAAFAIGGEGSLSLRVTQRFAVLLDYRESHSLLQRDGTSMTDVERYVLAGVNFRYY